MPALIERQTAVSVATASDVFETKLGWMAISWQGEAVARLTFGHDTAAEAVGALGEEFAGSEKLSAAQTALRRRLQAYAAGKAETFADIEIDDTHLTPFARRVVSRCRRIKLGQTLSYQELAAAAGSPGAARAVGNVMRSNRVPLIVPCHRVIGAGGQLGGYSAPQGLSMKARLLKLESAK